MQISALSTSTVSALDSSLYNRVYGRETSFSSQQTANISSSNQNSSILLSLSSRVDYYEATYTIEGTTENSSQVDQTATEETDSSLAAQVQNIQATYLEMIRKRVEYLLKELTSSINNQDTSKPYLFSADNVTDTTVSPVSTPITDSDYFSAEQTSQRIVQFALSFYDGGDRSEFVDMVKSAVMKGYNEAKKALGGYLPSVVDDTIALAMEAFDQFAVGSQVDFTA